jgi:hypothetical protein
VEVQQLQAVQHARDRQLVHHLHDLGAPQPELGQITRCGAPVSTATIVHMLKGCRNLSETSWALPSLNCMQQPWSNPADLHADSSVLLGVSWTNGW